MITMRPPDKRWAAKPLTRRMMFNRPPGGYSTSYPRACEQFQRYVDAVEPAPLALNRCGNVAAVMIPHIDYVRGWRTYAKLCRTMSALPRPDAIIMLGVWHNNEGVYLAHGEDTLFHMADRCYASSFGACPLPTGKMQRLGRLFREEFLLRYACLHDREHSLELPLPWLQFPYRGKTMPPLLPLLVGSFERFLQSKEPPESCGYVDVFFRALGDLLGELRENGERVLLVGSVDLSHKGTYHENGEPLSRSLEQQVREDDRELLGHLEHGDKDAFFRHLSRDSNWFNRDAFAVLYTMLASLRHSGVVVSGHVIDHQITVVPEDDNLVSLAGMLFTEAS